MFEVDASLIKFGYKDTKTHDLEIGVSFGPRNIRRLSDKNRKEMVYLLREYADQIESAAWLSSNFDLREHLKGGTK